MIIGISGKIGSGKDTVGKIIQYLTSKKDNKLKVETYLESQNTFINDGFEIKRFADKLKDIVCMLIGCIREQLEAREFKEKELGEEWRIWYMTHYKLSNNHHDGKIGKIYSSEEEILEYESSEFFENLRLEGYQIVSKILTPRLLLQLLGTECGREIIHPNIWVNSLFADYKAYKKTKSFTNPTLKDEESPNWIITDVRFPNEAKAIKDKGGIVIRINRPTKEDLEYKELCDKYGKQAPVVTDWLNKNKYKFTRQHESESALDDYQDWDYIIQNDGTIEDLIEKIKDIMVKRNLL